MDQLSFGQWLDLVFAKAWVNQEQQRRMKDDTAETREENEENRAEFAARVARRYGG